ncbi:MAG TPA: AMP-binding protein [Candidatus Limnocylindria bacterium]|nr:AMP-binding protein [Candidatus Limnocylindria bacterium]
MSLADLLRRRAADSAFAARPYLRFEDERASFAETHARAARWANFLLAVRDPARPFHVGLLLENRPEFVYAELGAAMAGAVVAGLNPTRRGSHLAADVTLADCQLVVTESRFAPLVEEAALAASVRVVDVDRDGALIAAQPATDPEAAVAPDDLFLLVFTSGTTGAPKAVMRGHGRLVLMAEGAAALLTQATPEDVVYCAMPLFHSNAQVLALGMSLASGCGLALARRFSKTRFLDDVRRHGATLFNYVGSPLAYVMDTPPRPDDADNPLRLAYGNEGPRRYLDAFARRFGCRVLDSYGASECGVSFTRQDGDPPGSLGRAGGGVAILNERGEECATALLDEHGRLLNPDEAIGEIVNTGGVGLFEGYYKDPEATAARQRGGRYHTGDLGYRDAQGYVYFAGRDVDWLRVDGENFLARPVETILERHPEVLLAAVYAVPDAEAGDRVMAALALCQGARFDGAAFARWLDAQPDCSPKWRPTFVRIVPELQRSETNKVQKRALQREGFVRTRPGDTLLWRPRGETAYRPFTADDLAALSRRFERAGNAARLEI